MEQLINHLQTLGLHHSWNIAMATMTAVYKLELRSSIKISRDETIPCMKADKH